MYLGATDTKRPQDGGVVEGGSAVLSLLTRHHVKHIFPTAHLVLNYRGKLVGRLRGAWLKGRPAGGYTGGGWLADTLTGARQVRGGGKKVKSR